MCCSTSKPHEFHKSGSQQDCFCGCDEPWESRRRFWTKAEKLSRLEKHLADLKHEIRGVEEYIAELNGSR